MCKYQNKGLGDLSLYKFLNLFLIYKNSEFCALFIIGFQKLVFINTQGMKTLQVW